MSGEHRAVEALHMREANPGVACDVHMWTVDDFLDKFVRFLREKHGLGGVNVCQECVSKLSAWRTEKDAGRGRPENDGPDAPEEPQP